MALAREIKAKKLLTQREFIRRNLAAAEQREDGDPSYVYKGHLYPENFFYFVDEELYSVEELVSVELRATADGKPLYLFRPNERMLGQIKENELAAADEQSSTEPCISIIGRRYSVDF